MSITGAVRVIKGQDVLPDGSTLEEHGIIDGSTVNIVIEPDKEITLRIKLGSKYFPHKVMRSVRVRELKQMLIDGGIVGFKNFSLIISSSDNAGITADFPLEDESLPLHLSTVSDNTTIRIIGGYIQIQLVTQRGKRWYKSFPRNLTLSQMKQRIRLVDKFFLAEEKDLLDDVWLFIQYNESFQRLDEDNAEQPVGSILSDNDVIYLVEDRFFPESDMYPVYYKGEEIGRVGWIMGFESVGYYRHYSDTALSLKLRIQEQLGFPVHSVNVRFRGDSMQNDETVNHGSRHQIAIAADIRVEAF